MQAVANSGEMVQKKFTKNAYRQHKKYIKHITADLHKNIYSILKRCIYNKTDTLSRHITNETYTMKHEKYT